MGNDFKISTDKDKSLSLNKNIVIVISILLVLVLSVFGILSYMNKGDDNIDDNSVEVTNKVDITANEDTEKISDEVHVLYTDEELAEMDKTDANYTNIPCNNGLKHYKNEKYYYITVSDLSNNSDKLIGERVCIVGKVGRTGNKCFELLNQKDGGFVKFNFICNIDPSAVKGQVVCLIGIVGESSSNELNIEKGHIIARGSDTKKYVKSKTSSKLEKLIGG